MRMCDGEIRTRPRDLESAILFVFHDGTVDARHDNGSARNNVNTWLTRLPGSSELWDRDDSPYMTIAGLRGTARRPALLASQRTRLDIDVMRVRVHMPRKLVNRPIYRSIHISRFFSVVAIGKVTRESFPFNYFLFLPQMQCQITQLMPESKIGTMATTAAIKKAKFQSFANQARKPVCTSSCRPSRTAQRHSAVPSRRLQPQSSCEGTMTLSDYTGHRQVSRDCAS